MADDVRVEMVREGSRMGLWLGELRLAEVEAGIPAQQLARYIEMQIRAGHAPEAIQAMLRGESKATTGSSAPARSSKARSSTKKKQKTAPKGGEGADLDGVLKGTVGAVKKRLATGDHDAHLDALVALESGGKARKGVLKALAARSDA